MKTVALTRTLFLPALLVLALLSGCKTSKTAAVSTEKTTSPATSVQETVSATQPAATGSTSALSIAPDENSLLWKISGNGLTQPSYLFGTIHMIGSEDYIFPASWDRALDETKQLYLELDMDDPGMMMKMMTGSMMTGGKSLKDFTTAEEYAAIETFFRDSLNQQLAIFSKMKPMLIASIIYPSMVRGEVKSYEMTLVEKAKERNFEVHGIESVEDQLTMMDQIPMDSQVEMLLAYVDDFPGERERFQGLLELYVSQNVNQLYEFMTDSPEMDEETRAIMLDARNQKWISQIEAQAKLMPTFFAFGAGHLAGDQGVIELLKKQGYTLEPVR